MRARHSYTEHSPSIGPATEPSSLPADAQPHHLDEESLNLWHAQRVRGWGTALVTLILIGFAVVFVRVAQLKVAPDPRLALAAGAVTSQRPLETRRGCLLDRCGRPVAVSTEGHRLVIDPQEVTDAQTIAVDVAHLIGIDPVELDRRILARREGRYVVASQLLDEEQKLAVRRADLRGVWLEPRLVRDYPFGETGAAIVGMVGFEHAGLSGLEHRYDGSLEPAAGRLTYLRDAQRRTLWIEPDDYQPPTDGEEVRLSIDMVIQEIVEERVRDAVKEYNAGGGRSIVLECRTGEILAIFDMLRARKGWEEQTDDPARAIHPALGRNRCATDPYEPGSTFKPFVWSVATELGLARLDEVLPTPAGGGWRTPYGRWIRDTFYYENSTWRRVLVKSQNTGMAMVAERMSHRQMRDVIRRYGFGEKTESRLPGESIGLVTSAKDWKKYTQSSVSFGHEISVTPLQMVRAFSAFARDGTLPALRLTAMEEEEKQFQFIRRAISEETAFTTREVLRDVMTEGSGRKAQSEKYQLFGKSGTAQLPKKHGGGYHEERYVSSFIAGAPYTDPRIVVLVVIDDPDRSKGHYGGAIAGPTVRDIIDEVLTYLGVAGDQPQPEKLAQAP